MKRREFIAGVGSGGVAALNTGHLRATNGCAHDRSGLSPISDEAAWQRSE